MSEVAKDIVIRGLAGFLIFGAVIALMVYAMSRNVPYALGTGAGAGAIFAAVMTAMFLMLMLPYRKERKIIRKDHKIFYEGAANHIGINETAGGWLFLTDKGLSFQSHGYQVHVRSVYLPLADIADCGKNEKSGGISVGLANGKRERFIVNGRKKWIRLIQQKAASSSNG